MWRRTACRTRSLSSSCRISSRLDTVRLAHTTSNREDTSNSDPELSYPKLGKVARRQAWTERIPERRDKEAWSERSKTTAAGKPIPLNRGKKIDTYRVAERVKELCVKGHLDDAVEMVASLPIGGLHNQVWKVLLYQAMRERKYNQAYSLYIEMKRRGFVPDGIIYTCMLQGWNSISAAEWPRYTKQLEHCHSVYQSYEEHMAACKERGDLKQLTILPMAYYLKILKCLRMYQKMFDIFYTMDSEGPLAPDASIYGTFFWAICERRSTEKLGSLTIDEQNAADAKLLWRQLEKDMIARDFELRWYTAVPLLRVLARGRPPDHQLAVDIIRDYYGLAPPGETPPPPKAMLTWEVFQAILDMCNKLRKYRLCVYYAKQIMDNKSVRAELALDKYHMDQVLIAYHSLAAVSSMNESVKAVELLRWMLRRDALDQENTAKLRPTHNTYSLALSVCWRCEDWESACEVFELMTGYSPSDFLDEPAKKGQQPTPLERSEGRNLVPDLLSMAMLARTALLTKDNAKMRQCLRMLSHVGGDQIFTAEQPEEVHYKSYYGDVLASCVIKMVGSVLSEAVSAEEKASWQRLRKLSRDAPRRNLQAPIPELEKILSLKSTDTLSVQQAVDFDMTARGS